MEKPLHCILLLVLISTLSAIVAGATCSDPIYVDSGPLPSAPVFPSATLDAGLTPTPSSSNPLTQDHWSEVANLAKYRPPKITPVADPAQTNCPHKQQHLKNWHDPSTWTSGSIPANGANVNIPANTAVLISSCSIDPSFVFGLISVPASSSLIFGDAEISISATGFNVAGSMYAGSQTCRLRNKITITLYGRRGAQAVPADPWVKGISVTGSIDLHGVQYYPTWTRLAMTAKQNDTWLFVQDIVNWQPGQTIAVTTTELKDSRDWHRNEERTIVAVKRTNLGNGNVCAIQIDSPLDYLHFGGIEYQAEVALLSRNIVVQGDATNSDPTDTTNVACTDGTSPSTRPCENSYLTGFGAHIFVNSAGAQGRFSGVEMYRVGQTNALARYPIHFHLLGNITASNYQQAFVQDCSVHNSYFRCYAIHGTSGVLLTQNTAYDAIGHCYFLEDGVEENNIISYNQGAHIHPLGPYWNPSIGANGDSWWAQYLSWYPLTDTLILPSDMAAGVFYLTNTYNDVYGNAASGGFAGFSVPSLKLPVKLFSGVNDMCPANRPFRSPFAGNSAHSSGFWWATAGGFYIGGELNQDGAGGALQYTSGRSLSRDTCADITASTPVGTQTGCWTVTDQRWLKFEDNKVFLSNRGMQNWGNRAEIIRFEIRDVSLSMNVFGQVWIDQMLMECRSQNHMPEYLQGCSTPNQWWNCNVRDYYWFQSFGGFQWYDTGQQHILTNSIFRNCRNDWKGCVGGQNCSNVAVFTSLTHSDQFLPELMQVTANLTYQSVTDLWRFSTQRTESTGVTMSGRLQNWRDADGSASLVGKRAMIGSAWSNDWWKYNDDCTQYIQAWRCAMGNGDSQASMIIQDYNPTLQAQIGSTICMNGGGQKPCPVVAYVSHFGSKNESAGLWLGANSKISGPIIAQAGGWFIRFKDGTPSSLTLTNVEVDTSDVLLLALPYPAGTKFDIYYQGAQWCSTSWAVCRHNYTAVSNISAVISAFGDAYFWDSGARILYLRVIASPTSFGSPGKDPAHWSPFPVPAQFSRGGQTLISPASQSYVIIKATCSSNPCAPQNDVGIPSAISLADPTTPTQQPDNQQSSPANATSAFSGVVFVVAFIIAIFI